MDCGEGVQRQVLARGIGLNKETTILITHLHGEHVTGLLGLLQTMSMAQRRRPLRIVGPPKLLKWLEATFDFLHIGLTFPIEFSPAKPGVVLRLKEFKVRAAKAVHSIEAYSYLLEEKGRPGVFHPEKAKSVGVPEGKLWSKLQRGHNVIAGGKMISASEVTGPPRPGRRVGYSGDTRPSAGLVRFFTGCDLLIFDSTFREADKEKAVERKHSTSVEAATVAKKAHARRLALTHFSARYGRVSSLVREARRVFPNSFAAADGMKVDVGYPSS
jgi:ribonuclease Z